MKRRAKTVEIPAEKNLTGNDSGIREILRDEAPIYPNSKEQAGTDTVKEPKSDDRLRATGEGQQ
jgi:hypothetical protein